MKLLDVLEFGAIVVLLIVCCLILWQVRRR
jgi:hypothetical protein